MGTFPGINSFNPMSLGNVQLPQAPMGPRAASPMNHSVPMNSMGSVPGVSLSTCLSCAERPCPNKENSLSSEIVGCLEAYSMCCFALCFDLSLCSFLSPSWAFILLPLCRDPWRSLMAWMCPTRARSTPSTCARSAKCWVTTAAECNDRP